MMNALIPWTRVDEVLDGFFRPSRVCAPGDSRTSCYMPYANILEGEKEFRILMDLPGVRNEDLEINIEQQTLLVKAERSFDVPEGFESRRGERGRSTFERSFRLGNAVDMMEWYKNNSIPVGAAQKVSEDEKKGKITIGILHDIDRPEFCDVYQKLTMRAKENNSR